MTPHKHKAKLRKLTGLCDDNDIDMATARVIKARMPKPNYFVAIRVSDLCIHSRVQTVQDTVVSHDERLEPALVPLETLHLTLLVIHLKNEEQIEKAKKILQQCRKELPEHVLPSGTFTLRFKGLDFRFPTGKNPWLRYVKPVGKEGIEKLEKVYNFVRKTFTKEGFPPTDPDRKFHPHVTIINLNEAPNLQEEGISKLPEKSFSNCRFLDFGEEQVSSLYLCLMGPERTRDGFYKWEAKIDFEAKDDHPTAETYNKRG